MHTEDFDARYHDLDAQSDDEIIGLIFDAQAVGLAATRTATAAIAAAASALANRLRSSVTGRLIYAGAGTSGRLGVLDGAELIPTFGWPAERGGFLIAGGLDALVKPIEGAEDDASAGTTETQALKLGADDAVIAISASGTTPYTLAVCEAARADGALTIGVANNAPCPLLDAAEHPIAVLSGAEPIGGSTRMTAGTVQKVTLNLLSTLTMIRLNRTYGGYMVDVLLTNDKLKARAVRMICEITTVDADAARAALATAGDNTKLAILIAKGVALDDANALLARHDGNLRRALAATAG
ncbi:MAG: N-acetylmuramic acid 6-phosphate etherase [Alphaproteobacteria bacterium]|nr:N-acetylmuramic acid 6-phosphate etherase [Alphaproteobacteria bacterium]